MARLGDLTNIKTGKLDANAASSDGQYPFFTCSKETLLIDNYRYDCECVLVAGNGDLNVKYYNGKFDAYQRTYIIESKDKSILFVPYLYRFLDKYVETLREQSIGGVIKYIKLGNLTDAEIPLPSLQDQQQIVAVMDKLNDLISLRKQQLAKLDEAVKSRFIELFGNLKINSHGWKTETFGTCFDITSSKRILKSEWKAEGVPFLRVRDMVQLATTGTMDNEFFVSEEFYSTLSDTDGVPRVGDILVSATSTLGKCYIVKQGERFYFKDADVIRFRAKKKIDPLFFIEQLKSNYIEEQISRTLGVTTVAHFTIKAAKKIEMRLPELTLQKQFAAFVRQIDKSKLTIQQSLDKLETLKKSLMQQYFG